MPFYKFVQILKEKHPSQESHHEKDTKNVTLTVSIDGFPTFDTNNCT